MGRKKKDQNQITGFVTSKSGKFYMAINLQGKPKWHRTGLGDKKMNLLPANVMLAEKIKEYEEQAKQKQAIDANTADTILFSDFLLSWLKSVKPSVEESTYTSYRNIIAKRVAPYFAQRGCTLADVEKNPELIHNYYVQMMTERNNKAATVRRHHANIRKCLQYAMQLRLIKHNPADIVSKPKVQKYVAEFYSAEELMELFTLLEGRTIHLPVIVAACYGLRRSEVLGLKWSAIDFANRIITIRHTVTNAEDDKGNKYIVMKDRTKNKSSFRSLPLIPQVEEALLAKKAQDAEYRQVCGNCYHKDYQDYIFVDELGILYDPVRVSGAFKYRIEKLGVKKIRFHDLRHSCASLLLNNGVSMKEIQEWLGHSTFATTADLYAHVSVEKKQESANIVSAALCFHQNATA